MHIDTREHENRRRDAQSAAKNEVFGHIEDCRRAHN